MGSAQSIQADEEEEDDEGDNGETEQREVRNPLMKKVLEQEPEMLPCHASASPLSPQLSTVGTPHLGPSVKVWDPCNVLAPPPPPPPPPPLPPTPTFSRISSSDALDDDWTITEVFLFSHGECGINLRPDFIAGRWPDAALTSNGKRQARALAVFLKSHGVRFNAVYSSPLDRARATAISVCQELNFSEEQIQPSDALIDMSQGLWEGYLRSEVYSPELLSLIERYQPDFSAPSGESLRQVEFRMIQFLNSMVLIRLHERLRNEDLLLLHQNESKGFITHNLLDKVNSVQNQDEPVLPPPHWDLLHRHKHGLTRKKSGKSRLQFVTKNGDHEAECEISPQEATNQEQHHEERIRNSSSSSYCIGVFTHAVPIKCVITGILGCSPAMSQKICIDDSSMTLLQHSIKTGWQIKNLNDTAHLRLL